MLDNFIEMQKGEGSTLVPDVQGLISLKGQYWNDQSPGNHTDGGLTGSLPSQCPSRAPNNTKPKMIIGLGKGAITSLVCNYSSLVMQLIINCAVSSHEVYTLAFS